MESNRIIFTDNSLDNSFNVLLWDERWDAVIDDFNQMRKQRHNTPKLTLVEAIEKKYKSLHAYDEHLQAMNLRLSFNPTVLAESRVHYLINLKGYKVPSGNNFITIITDDSCQTIIAKNRDADLSFEKEVMLRRSLKKFDEENINKLKPYQRKFGIFLSEENQQNMPTKNNVLSITNYDPTQGSLTTIENKNNSPYGKCSIFSSSNSNSNNSPSKLIASTPSTNIGNTNKNQNLESGYNTSTQERIIKKDKRSSSNGFFIRKITFEPSLDNDMKRKLDARFFKN